MIQSSDDIVAVPASVTGTAYTPAKADGGRVLETSNAAAVTITLPPSSTTAWRIGTLMQVYQGGAGQVTIVGGAGVTLRSSGGKFKTVAQYSVISLRMRATDEWVVSGDTLL